MNLVLDHYRSLYGDRGVPPDLVHTLGNTTLVGFGSRERLVRIDIPFAVVYRWPSPAGELGWCDLTLAGELLASERRRWASSSVVAYIRASLRGDRMPQIAWAKPPTKRLVEQVEQLVRQHLIQVAS